MSAPSQNSRQIWEEVEDEDWALYQSWEWSVDADKMKEGSKNIGLTQTFSWSFSLKALGWDYLSLNHEPKYEENWKVLGLEWGEVELLVILWSICGVKSVEGGGKMDDVI